MICFTTCFVYMFIIVICHLCLSVRLFIYLYFCSLLLSNLECFFLFTVVYVCVSCVYCKTLRFCSTQVSTGVENAKWIHLFSSLYAVFTVEYWH